MDPFAAGLRWIHSSGPTAPWIPRDVTFVGEGELLWAAPAHQNPGLLLCSTADQGQATVLFADPGFAVAIGPIRVAAGDESDELFAVAQYAAPTSSQRRSLVTRHDALAAAAGAAFVPRWTHDLELVGNGPALLATPPDGRLVVAAALDATTQTVRVEALDASDGLRRFRVDLSGSGLSALALSDDGSRIALATGTRVWVLDGSGVVVWNTVLGSNVGALDLAADGSLLAYASGSQVQLFRYSAASGTFVSELTRTGGVGEVVVELDLSADGSTLAAAWWGFGSGVDVRAEVLDTATRALVNTYSQAGGGTLQNFPSGLELSADGRRLVLGLWGAGDTRPELVLLDRTEPVPVLAADLPGSAYAVALDASGTRLVAAAKDTHANLFSAAGELVLFDTGERDLQLTAAVRPGGSAEMAYRMAEDGLALFAAGFALDAPRALKGQALWIDWNRPHFVMPGLVTPGAGRANLSVGIAPDASLVGVPLAVQAATLGASGVSLSARVVRPPVL